MLRFFKSGQNDCSAVSKFDGILYWMSIMLHHFVGPPSPSLTGTLNTQVFPPTSPTPIHLRCTAVWGRSYGENMAGLKTQIFWWWRRTSRLMNWCQTSLPSCSQIRIKSSLWNYLRKSQSWLATWMNTSVSMDVPLVWQNLVVYATQCIRQKKGTWLLRSKVQRVFGFFALQGKDIDWSAMHTSTVSWMERHTKDWTSTRWTKTSSWFENTFTTGPPMLYPSTMPS